MKKRHFVSIVDDDSSVRESLSGLLRSVGYDTQVFSSAEEYLERDTPQQEECLILDVCMPAMTGPQCGEELVRRGVSVPIIYITARVDPRLHHELLARGALTVLTKPFGEEALLVALETVFEGKENEHGT